MAAHKVDNPLDGAELYYHKVRLGLCVRCPLPAEPGHTMCGDHLLYYRLLIPRPVPTSSGEATRKGGY